MRTRCVSVDKGGRIAIPAEMRRALGLQPGSRIVLSVDGNGGLVGHRVPALEETEGMVRPLHPMSEDFDDEIEEAIAAAMAEEDPWTRRR